MPKMPKHLVLALGVGSLLVLSASPHTRRVHAYTLAGHILVGYQGWFGCPNDYAVNQTWLHWFQDDLPDAAHLRVDLLPDVSQYPTDTLCHTLMKDHNGNSISLYSGINQRIINLHFRWMEQYGINGAAVQRFVVATRSVETRSRWDLELQEEQAAAERTGRVFFVSYDVSGANPKSVTEDIERDWKHLVDDLKITSSAQYLYDKSKPVLELWGFGVVDRPGTPDDVISLIKKLRSGSRGIPSATIVGGVAPEWRTLDGSSKTDARWANVYRSFDVISPWFTGRFNNSAAAVEYLSTRARDDWIEAQHLGIGYMPVVFPGFSWSNLMWQDDRKRRKLNQIPRDCGRFFWTQLRTLIGYHMPTLYVAMFDEVDEGTAIFKTIAHSQDLPQGTSTLGLDVDGCELPSDWYLKITGTAQHYLAAGVALPPQLDQGLR